jgi:hypothetical protein
MDPHHFGKLEPDPHQSERLNPDPHQSEKQDLDPCPHQSDADLQQRRDSEKPGHITDAWYSA